VDFLIPHGAAVVPVEVKAGKLRSLHQFIDRSPCRLAIRLHAGPLDLQQISTPSGTAFKMLNLPYFLASKLHDYVDWMAPR
jgi:hypothetical protein